MLQVKFTPQQSLLLLEGLWDQLELVVGWMRTCDQQPVALQNARSRIASYRGRLREIIAKMQSDGATDSEAYTRRLNVTLCEVAEILGHVQHEPAVNWIEILFQAQDATLTALQELRLMARTPPLISADERMNAQ